MIDTLIVLAKRPVAGRVKTRLVPPLAPGQAAAIAAAALTDTLHAVNQAPARRRMLAFDARPGHWLPTRWSACRQPEGNLDVRIGAAFAAAGPGSAVLVGMDTPQLRPEHVAAFRADRFDACLGPASDGGYWALGFRNCAIAGPALLGVPMSRPDTAEHQLRRLRELGLRVQLLDELRDVDTVDDLFAVADLVPAGAFGQAARAVTDALLDRVR